MAKSEKETEAQERVQRKYFEAQMLAQQLQKIEQQIQQLGQQTEELRATKESIGKLGATGNDTAILVPVAGGIFAKARITDAKSLLVNVGADTVVEKTVPEVQAIIDEQIKDIQDVQSELTTQLQALAVESEHAQEALKKMVGSGAA